MITQRYLRETAASAADRLIQHPWRVWFWGDSIGLEGLLDASELTGDGRYLAFVHGLLKGWIAREQCRGEFDHTAPGGRAAENLGEDPRSGPPRRGTAARGLPRGSPYHHGGSICPLRERRDRTASRTASRSCRVPAERPAASLGRWWLLHFRRLHPLRRTLLRKALPGDWRRPTPRSCASQHPAPD